MTMRVNTLFALAFWWGLSGCATAAKGPSTEEPRGVSSVAALANARTYLNERPDWNIDCSGFVRACYRSAEMTNYAKRQPPGRNLSQTLFRYCTDHWKRRARFADIRPGDMLIFNMTYDANRDGRINEIDRWTHAGIAESFQDGLLIYLDASKGRKGPKLRRRSFSIKTGGKNETVATDPATGTKITHRETFDSSFGME
jgi:hypothetical protein